MADHFCKKGFEVYGIDLRGFGYSGGPRGCSTLTQMITDIGTLLTQVKQNIPLFLYGHSMGGLLVLIFTLLNE
jgi:alpha-beta hydrolase superfamily lysophospholipase